MATSETAEGPSRVLRGAAAALALALALAACGGEVASPPYDLLLRGGTVVDGTGDPRFEADVAVTGDRIARVAPDGLPPDSAREVLDADGLVVSPGFVDHHARVQAEVLERPLLENFLRQGITTTLASVVTGSHAWPREARAEDLGSALNVGFVADHRWVRREVLGEEDRIPTEGELQEMEERVVGAMRQGALGLHAGFRAGPAARADAQEMVELARAAAEHGGIYFTHPRNHGPRLVESVEEAVEVARASGVPVQIQHLKVLGPPQWGRSREALAVIDAAREEGLDVVHDLYPYDAANMDSEALFPAWALAGGRDSLRARLEDPETREVVEREVRERWLTEWAGEDLGRLRFRDLPAEPQLEGATMRDLLEHRGLPTNVETAVEVLVELELEGGFGVIVHGMDEEDVIRIMEHPAAMFQTDGAPAEHGFGRPHPRSYGAFPRVFGRYVRELGVLTLEEAVHRMTGASMEQLGQADRGLVREGLLADLVAFDPGAIRSPATYADPHRYSTGVFHAVVNGVPVLRDGSVTGETPGRVLAGPAR